jgi:thioredoxin 1
MALNTTEPMPDLIRSVTGATFESLVLNGQGPIVVNFMSYGCAHCRTIEPILEKVAEIAKPKIYRLNIAVEQELAEAYEVQGTPTLVMFLNGQQVGRSAGPEPTEKAILALFNEAFEA